MQEMQDLTSSKASSPENLEDRQPYEIFSQEMVKRTRRKVDIRLLPILGSIAALGVIDRINLSNVRISGADKEIGLGTGNHYSLTALVFFIPYVCLEIPANVLFHHVSASLYLGTIGLLWGVIMIAMGFVRTWVQMAVLRCLLGILEAAFYPACLWLISCWYTRAEVQVRLASFYIMGVAVASFSNILAYGLSTIRAYHLSGWRWILIIEGIATCLISILGYFIIADFPDKNRFLTSEETTLIKERLDQDRGDVVYDPLTFQKGLQYFRDLKLWSFGLAYLCATTMTYTYAYFTTLILIGIGFSVKNAQLLVAPSGIGACLVTLIMSRIADRYRVRGIIIVIQVFVSVTGLSLMGFHPNNSVRLAGVFIGSTGAYGNIPAILAYQSNNIRRQSMRSFGSALQIALGGFGGIVASLVYRQQDAPRYKFGIMVTISLQGLLVTLVGLNSIYFSHRNRQAREGGKPIEGLPGFLYTL